MAASPTIKGKQNLIKHFQATKCPYWKLYNAHDAKAPIMSYNNDKNIVNSLGALTEFCDILDEHGLYVLDTFVPVEGSKDKSMIRPEQTVCFTLQDHYQNAPAKQHPSAEGKQVSGYTPEFGEHIALIKENAKHKGEYDYCSLQLKDALIKIGELENKNKVLQDSLENGEFDEEEEEDDDDDSIAGVGSAKDRLMNAFAGLLETKGGLIVENVFGSKLKTDTSKQPINDTNEENEAFISICNSLKEHDPELLKHLVKLHAIAVNMPDTFKVIIDNLEKLGE